MHAAICLETCQFPDAINKIGRPGFPDKALFRKRGNLQADDDPQV
jgi:hypothetical protein